VAYNNPFSPNLSLSLAFTPQRGLLLSLIDGHTVTKELELKAVVGAQIVIVPDELYEGHAFPPYFLIAFRILLDNAQFVQRRGQIPDPII